MQRIEKWKQKAWFSLLLNVILLALLLLIFKPGYETNDDIGIQNIVSGVKGRSDAHLVYVNYLLGWLLAFAYKICPVHISVYAIAQYLTMLFAFTAIAYVLLNKIKNKSAFWITLALFRFRMKVISSFSIRRLRELHRLRGFSCCVLR